MIEQEGSGLDRLRSLAAEGTTDRRRFLIRALELGVSAASAYALLGPLADGEARASPTPAQLEDLGRRLAEHPAGKVVSPEATGSEADGPQGVRNRIDRLRARHAAERSAGGPPQATPPEARRTRLQLAQDWDNWNDWNNWDNWDNWNNWDNWQDWNNWGNSSD